MSRWGIIDNTLEGRQKLYFPHWFAGKCLTDPEANRAQRQRLFFTSSLKDRKELRKMCSEDLLFYAFNFVQIFKAMGRPGPIPFNLHDFQIECLTMLWKCMHEEPQEDCRIVKPRYVGATWMIVLLFEHAWHFMKHIHLLLGSRVKEEVDGTTSDADDGATMVRQWDKLLPKVDFIHLNQPSWLLPDGYVPCVEPYRTKFKITNPETSSIISGQAASVNWGRSGRYYATGYDEHAHTDAAYEIIGSSSRSTECHFWWSSPNGPDTAFTRICGTLENQIKLNFWMMPENCEGMTVDAETGEKSSPAMKREKDRLGNDERLVKNEIYADETYAVGCFYPPMVFDVMEGVGKQVGTVRDPEFRGEFMIEDVGDQPVVRRFVEQPGGRWVFWRLDDFRAPDRNTLYILGIDVAAGSQDKDGRGASNSVIGVCNAKTGEIVAEFVAHGFQPYELAKEAAAAGHWFNGEDHEPALIVFETGGPGSQFLTELKNKYEYRRIWMESRGSGTKGEMGYGWAKPRGDTAKDPEKRGQAPFGLHVRMLLDGGLIERSSWCVDEMRCYQHTGGGAPVHSSSMRSDDPSSARENHGDRVISRLAICQALRKWRKSPPEHEKIIQPGSLNWVRHRDKIESNERRRVGQIGVPRVGSLV